MKMVGAFETIKSDKNQDAKRWSNGPGYDITPGEHVGVSVYV